jgi:ABC-type uncharacterized transport system YnjBCD permease subunit
MKFVIVIAFVVILGALAAAGLFMLRNSGKHKGGPRNMARALTLRIGLSVALFLFILLAYSLGWITPTGLPLQQ